MAAQGLIGLRGEFVGSLFDRATELVGGRRRFPGHIDEAPRSQPIDRLIPVVLGPTPAAPQQLGRHALGRREQDMGLAPVERAFGEDRDVAVTSVFSQGRRRLPHRRHAVHLRQDIAVCGEEGATGGAPSTYGSDEHRQPP